jgi:hypothetical protein
LRLGRPFDLPFSLEAGEHLEPELAPSFVHTLVAHASHVLFSAAIPYQTGPAHVNDAWQSTWASLFAEHGCRPVDVIHQAVWTDDRVAYWYARNMFHYIDETQLDRLRRDRITEQPILDLVHPKLHMRMNTRSETPPTLSLSRLPREAAAATRRALTRRLAKP